MSNSQNFNKDRKASMAEGYDTPMTTNKCAINSHRPKFRLRRLTKTSSTGDETSRSIHN